MALKNCKYFESQAKKKNIKYSSLFIVLTFRRFKLVLVSCVLELNKFRTSSPPTSCCRLGLCSSTPSRSWWSWLTSSGTKKSAVGHDYVNKTNYQLIKIKFTLDKIWTGNSATGDRRRSDKLDPGDRETVPWDQGGAVVPDCETAHEIERPETHVKTECKK